MLLSPTFLIFVEDRSVSEEDIIAALEASQFREQLVEVQELPGAHAAYRVEQLRGVIVQAVGSEGLLRHPIEA